MAIAAALAAGLLSAASLAPAPAAAMTVLKAPLPELVGASALVLHAKVIGSRVHDRRAQGRAVFTETTLQVIEVYKGDAKRVGKTFSWEMVGGTAGGLTWSMPGMPTFQVGEEVVVLLEKHAHGYTLTGAPQGKYSVYRDAKGVARVRQRLGDVHFMQRDRKTGAIVNAPKVVRPALLLQPPRADRPLASLRAEVLAAVKAHAKAAQRPKTQGKSALPVAKPMRKRTVGTRKP